MGEQGNNDRPPGPDGVESNETAIVLASSVVESAKLAPSTGLVWCILGAILCTIMVPVGIVVVAAGSAVLSGMASKRSWLGYAMALLVPAFGYALGGYPSELARDTACYLIAYAVGSRVVRDDVSSGRAVACAVVASVALFGIDMAIMATAGLSMTNAVAQTFDATVRAYESQMGIRVASELEGARSMVLLLWPSCYALMGALTAWFALVGARSGARRAQVEVSGSAGLAAFDLPLWVVAALVAGVFILVLGRTLPGAPHRVTMVGANLLMASRIALAVQGLAVIAWVCQRFGLGRIVRFFLFVLAVNLEISLMAVSVVGLVDVWANFRHLIRGGEKSQEQAA